MFSLTLNRRQLYDLELLGNGALNPLSGYMGRDDYERVLQDARLVDNTLWPIPVVLAISEEAAEQIAVGDLLGLRDGEGVNIACLRVNDIWQPDRMQEAHAIYGTTSRKHPSVRTLLDKVQKIYVGGIIEFFQQPSHYDFLHLRQRADKIRGEFESANERQVVGFQTWNICHRLERDLIINIAKKNSAKVLLLPVVDQNEARSREFFSRVQSCEAILRHLPQGIAKLYLLPVMMRMAGPRETLWKSIIHRNYGCSHFVVGPNDCSPLNEDTSQEFYGKYESQEFLEKYVDEIGIQMVAVEEQSYSVKKKMYISNLKALEKAEKISNYAEKDLRNDLALGNRIPDWFSFPEVIQGLSKIYPSNSQIGFTLFFTGLSGSGKSTLAKTIEAILLARGERSVTLLDGDIVRHNLSSELGFSRAHRDLNIQRIGFVANEITKNRGIAICAPIAPYRAVRREVRSLIQGNGRFIEVYLCTPISVCEKRARKGLYAKARAGEIKQFTGVSDPYEVPENAEIVIDTSKFSVTKACDEIIDYLLQNGFLALT